MSKFSPRILITVLVCSTINYSQINIACIGNSITKGRVCVDGGYITKLSSLLGSGYTVGSFASSGRSCMRPGDINAPRDPIFNITEFYTANPDIVTIMFGTNDAWSSWEPLDAYKDLYESEMIRLVDTIQQTYPGIPIYLYTPPPTYQPRFRHKDPIMEIIAGLNMKVARDKGLTGINVRDPMVDHPEWFHDGTHPNCEGHQVIAEIAHQVLTGQRDFSPPSIPSDFSATPVSDNQIELSWSSSGDIETGVLRYHIFRDGKKIGMTSTTDFVDSHLDESTDFSYTVTAVNEHYTESAPCSPVSVTTPSDNAAPSILSVQSVHSNIIAVHFNEPIGQSGGTSAGSYTIDNSVTASSARLWSNQLGYDSIVTRLVNTQHMDEAAGISPSRWRDNYAALITLPILATGQHSLTVTNISDAAQSSNRLQEQTIDFNHPLIIEAEADAGITWQGNDGSSETIMLRTDERNIENPGIMRFDLSSAEPFASIAGAELLLTIVDAHPTHSSGAVMALYKHTDDSWQENGSAPVTNHDNFIDSTLYWWYPMGGQFSFTVTDAVREELAGDKKLSIYMEQLANDVFNMYLASREHPEPLFHPKIIIYPDSADIPVLSNEAIKQKPLSLANSNKAALNVYTINGRFIHHTKAKHNEYLKSDAFLSLPKGIYLIHDVRRLSTFRVAK